jgi:hypothetical protein
LISVTLEYGEEVYGSYSFFRQKIY